MSHANSRQVGGNHYKKFKIEIWDFIVQNDIPYLEGNAIKYIARWRDKGGVGDLDKAIHYLQKLKEIHAQETERNIKTDFEQVNARQNINTGSGLAAGPQDAMHPYTSYSKPSMFHGIYDPREAEGALRPDEQGW